MLLLWLYMIPRPGLASIVAYTAAFGLLGLQMYSLPEEYHWVLASAAIPISCASRLPQVGRIGEHCCILRLIIALDHHQLQSRAHRPVSVGDASVELWRLTCSIVYHTTGSSTRERYRVDESFN